MLDVPMLALSIWAVWPALEGAARERGRFPGLGWFAAAGLAFALAIMMKYSAVTLAPCLLVLAWLRRRPGILIVFIPPTLALALWAWHNLHFHGEVQFLNLPDFGGTEFMRYIFGRRAYHILTALGAIFFLSLPVLIGLWRRLPETRPPLLIWLALLGAALAAGVRSNDRVRQIPGGQTDTSARQPSKTKRRGINGNGQCMRYGRAESLHPV